MTNGFEHLMTGAGIHAYWVLDEENAGPHEIFADLSDRISWAAPHRNSSLSEFVHLMFADSATDLGDIGGASHPDYGAYVFVETKWDQSQTMGFDFYRGLSRTAAHEITHLLIDPPVTPGGFDGTEHLVGHWTRLMARFNALNRTTMNFSDLTRVELNLAVKESVEI